MGEGYSGGGVSVVWRDDNVLEAARKRIAFVFDRYEEVVVSVSSGKDSTVMYHLAIDEAERRKRKVRVFFLDQEAEYDCSVKLIEQMMSHPAVIPEWYQVPIQMTNATSHQQVFLNAWHEGEDWIRPKHPMAIHSIAEKYPNRFQSFFEWNEKVQKKPTAFLVGLRTREALTRFRSVTRNAGYHGASWSTKTKNPNVFRFYPVYDWRSGDIWKYIADHGVPYNAIYDRMWMKQGGNIRNMRISNLVHEKAFRCLADLQEYEPDLYDRLIKRLKGVHCAALYAKDQQVFSASSIPASFETWRQYRDYLLDSTPLAEIERFRKRFAKQAEDEATCRQQVQQILINDWENNVPVLRTKAARIHAAWWDRL